MNSSTYDHHDDNESLIARIVDEFTDKLNQGEHPDVEEFVRGNDAVAAELRQLLQPLAAMHQNRPEYTAPPQTLGEYRILREIGRGGMGVVYEAQHRQLKRRVALKVLPESHSDAKFRQRFEREARAAANLHHTNIVPVYETGACGFRQFIAMQFIAGCSLDHVIRQRTRRRPATDGTVISTRQPESSEGQLSPTGPTHPTLASDNDGVAAGAWSDATGKLINASDRDFIRASAEIGAHVAEALAYAHDRGVIHRDIKPSNLLLDDNGTVWVTDFGLAKTEDENLTSTGDILGTLRYMAPERFHGSGDERSDVYALGITIYELLTLRPAFDGNDRMHLWKQIAETEPQRPRRISAAIPRDLETVILKAMAKDCGRRYQSCAALADDLRRCLRGEPIRARRITPVERLALWMRRKPALAGLLAAALLAVLLAAGLVAYVQINHALETLNQQLRDSNQSLAKATKVEKAARARAEAAELLAQRSAYNSAVFLSHLNWNSGNPEVARKLHAAAPPSLRGWEWHYLDRIYYQDMAAFSTGDSAPRRVAVSAGGGWAAWIDDKRRIKVMDVATKKPLLEHDDSAWLAEAMAVGPNGKLFAAAFLPRDKTLQPCIKIWHAPNRKWLQRIDLPAKHRAPFGISFNADGSRIADGLTRQVWESKTGRPQLKLANVPGILDKPGPFSPAVEHLAFDRGDRWIAGSAASHFIVWDGRTGALILKRKAQPFCHGLEFAGPGVLALANRPAQLWSVGNRLLRSFSAHALAIDPSGRMFAVAPPGKDHRVELMSLKTGKKATTIRGANAPIADAAFDRNGRFVAVGSYDRHVRIYPVADDGANAPWNIGREGPHRLVFDPSSEALATSAKNGLQLRDSANGKKLGDFQPPEAVRCIAYRPDGAWLAVGCGDAKGAGKIYVRDRNDRTVASWTVPWPVTDLAFCPATNRLAAAGGAQVQIWDVQNQKCLLTLDHRSRTYRIAFSPDGKLLAVGCRGEEGAVCVWDAANGKRLQKFAAHAGGVGAVAFAPKRRQLATAGDDTSVKLWDPVSGKVQFHLVSHMFQLSTLAFHPSEDRLVSGGGDGTLKLWDTKTGQLVLSLGQQRPVAWVALDQDGDRLAEVSVDGDVSILLAKQNQ